MASKQPEFSADLKALPNDVPSYFVDGAVGVAWANGVHRVLFAQYAVDPTQGAELPGVRHMLQLIMTTEGARTLVDFLQAMPGVKPDEG
jgi:hypothetical protein